MLRTNGTGNYEMVTDEVVNHSKKHLTRKKQQA